MPVQRRMHPRAGRARAGFTLIELVVVILIAGIIGTVAIPQFSRYTSMRAATNARDAFIAAASQARAAAIQLGEEVRLEVRPDTGLIRARVPRNDSTIALLDLAGGDFPGTIIAPAFNVCYVPRGYAGPGAGCTFPDSVGFRSPQGGHTRWARMTIGRVERR